MEAPCAWRIRPSGPACELSAVEQFFVEMSPALDRAADFFPLCRTHADHVVESQKNGVRTAFWRTWPDGKHKFEGDPGLPVVFPSEFLP
jgi:hypothetical protein